MLHVNGAANIPLVCLLAASALLVACDQPSTDPTSGDVRSDRTAVAASGADGGWTTVAATDSGMSLPDEGGHVSVDGGFGILGDSDSDEYRADDDRGGEYAAVTFNWMEQLVKARSIDFGAWGTWDDARRTGFEYNWARSGARAADLVEQGQAAGLAQQIKDGAVKYVYVHVGANDFHLVNGSYREIYDGTLTDSQVTTKVSKVVRDITEAIDIVLAEGPERVVVTLYGDPGLNPPTSASYPSAAGRDRVSTAIASVNDGLREMARSRPQLTLYDLNSFISSILDRIDGQGNLDVGGEVISLMETGDEPHHAQLGDSSGHMGTVASGLFANATFIGPFNEAEQLGIPLLTDAEILSLAGL